MNLTKINFIPKLKYFEAEYYLKRDSYSFTELKLENIQIYKLVKKLTDMAFPSNEDKFDKRWHYFYLPVKRSGRLITIPFGIVEYNKDFFISFHQLGNLHITKGKEKVEKEYKTIFKETLRFIPLIKKTENKILEKTVPYDIRAGKIKGKFILEKLISEEEKKKILLDYNKHLKKELKTTQISLNDYLNVAALCYKVAYAKKTKKLSPIEMYKKLADGRDCGMLNLKNKDSKKAYSYWLKHKSHCGGHPFEIVFSWHSHGIRLYPPYSDLPYYSLRVTNYAYALDFIKMIKVLIKKEIPFQAKDLKDVVNYLAGETYFSVNKYDEHLFHYIPSKEYKKLYFYHIEWDKIEVPKWT